MRNLKEIHILRIIKAQVVDEVLREDKVRESSYLVVDQLSIVKVRVVLRDHEGFKGKVLVCTICQFLDNPILECFEDPLVLIAVMDFSNSDLAELESDGG